MTALMLSAADATLPPRTLLIDMTPFGGATATGELKRAYFELFEKHHLLHLYAAPRGCLGLAPGGDITAADAVVLHGEDSQLTDLIATFDPEVIVYRPVADRPDLHKISMKLIGALGRPWIIWMMDDWPERLRAQDNARFEVMNRDLRKLLRGATDRFAISEAMAEAFGSRYDVEFKVFRNGATPSDWVGLKKDAGMGGPLRIRYAGSLAPDTTCDSVYEIAQVIEELAGQHPLTFEIRTQSTWYRAEKDRYRGLKHVIFETSDLDEKAYRQWLAEADILVLAYNFDAETIRYLQYSFANKTPEYLASGVPVLAYGSRDIATVRFLVENNVAAVVDSRDTDKLAAALEKLIVSKAYRDELVFSARAVAFSILGIDAQRRSFMRALSKAAKEGSPVPDTNRFEIPLKNRFEIPLKNGTLALAYERGAQAHIDETKLVSVLLGGLKADEPVMIDVGAHAGGSAAHFVEKGWKIYCFEPDPGNREKLIAKFGKTSNVAIDRRAVGEKAEKGKPFFTSKQSTGISGLSAFHETHMQSGVVDVTTVTEIVGQNNLDRIDFLKIDVEGFDFAVLRGVPWDRIRPAAIECEFEDAKTVPLGHNWRDMAEFLLDKGYTVYVSEWHPIIRYGIRHDWFGLKRYPCDLASVDAWGNLLAFLNEPEGKAIAAALEICVTVKNPEMTAKQVSEQIVERSSSPAVPAFAGYLARLRRWTASRYATFAWAVRSRSLVLFHIGQLGIWSLRAARRHRVASLLLLTSVAALTVLPLYRTLWDYRVPLWTGAGVVLLGAVACALASAVYEAWQRIVVMLRGDVAAARRESEHRAKAIEARVAVLSAELEELYTPNITHQKDLDSLRNEIHEMALGHLNSILQETDTLRQQLAPLSDMEKALRGIDTLEQKTDALLRQMTPLSVTEKALGSIDTLERETRLFFGKIEKALGQTINEVAGQSKEIDALKQQVAAVRDVDSAILQSLQEQELKFQALRDEIDAVKTKSGEVSGKLASISAKVDQNTLFQRFNRVLTHHHMETLRTTWGEHLGVTMTKPSLAYMAHRIRIIEQNAMGRLATQIEDAVLRTLVSSAVRAKKLEVLEIGTLFGIGLAMIYEHNRGLFDAVHVTAIDPLDGYYDKSVPDVLLNIPITKATFWHNMDMAGVPREDVTLIDGLSTDAKTIASAKKKKYDILVIDGDHTYAGVKADFDGYLGMMCDGGYIIFDDYGSEDWPDVKRFVDEEVISRGDVVFVGAEWRTAVFRVVESEKQQDIAEAAATSH